MNDYCIAFRLKHILFLFGMLSFIFSFLFFGRLHETFNLLFLGGILIIIISSLFILFGNERAKIKLFWLIVLVSGFIVNYLTENYFKKSSYLIYLDTNQIELNQVVDILNNKSADISFINENLIKGDSILSQNEIETIANLKSQLGVYTITKSRHGIYFGLWGFLGVRLGITYVDDIEKTNLPYRNLKDNWYH